MSTDLATTLHLASPKDTAALAQALAPLLQPGDVILLAGQIGAGKTHFARAVIQARLSAAGRQEDVPSPTFTIIQTYHDGAAEICHADLYRLTDADEVFELGLADAFHDAICLVEWPDRLGHHAPGNALRLSFAPGNEADTRILTIESISARWARVIDRLTAPAIEGR